MPIFVTTINITLVDNSICTTINNINSNFDSLCLSCMANKQIQVVICNKPMTKIDRKLNKVHVKFWGPHHPFSLSSKAYTTILLVAKTPKI